MLTKEADLMKDLERRFSAPQIVLLLPNDIKYVLFFCQTPMLNN